MHIGVKFCGGCNPRFDRRAYYEDTIKRCPSHDFSIAEDGGSYDCLLVIGGCSSCCASCAEYEYKKLVKVWDEADKPEFDQIKSKA